VSLVQQCATGLSMSRIEEVLAVAAADLDDLQR
jgi:hypothetical protein